MIKKENKVDLDDPIVKAIWELLEQTNLERKLIKENSIEQNDFDIYFRNGIYGEPVERKINE